jgi:hypothetical protein
LPKSPNSPTCWAFATGTTRGEPSWGFTFFGFFVGLTFDALWSGIGLSINVWEHKKLEPAARDKSFVRQSSMHSGV